jgi:hypothetical protein
MSRKVLIPLLAAAFLAAPTFAPAALTGLSDTAMAATTIHGSRSNGSFRTGGGGKPKASRAVTVHGTKSNSSFRAVTVKGSKSNQSYRIGGGGGGNGASKQRGVLTVRKAGGI